MLAPAFIPLLVIVALIGLTLSGAWPFGPLTAVAIGLVCFALAIALVRIAARMSGPEPPRHVMQPRA